MAPEANLEYDYDDRPMVINDEYIVYTEEELLTMRRVRASLIADYGIERKRIGLRALALTTILSKNRVDEATKKYAKFLEALEGAGIESLADDEIWNEDCLRERLDQYHLCGTDDKGRDIMWIRSRDIALHETNVSARAALMYYMAQHASPTTLRQGVGALVIDVTERRTQKYRYGNEKILQTLDQAYPMRPQAIIIAGCSVAMRIFVNSLIALASVFAKEKILKRIKFASVEDAMKEVLPDGRGPKYCGGDNGGIDDNVKYIKERIESIPIPDLCDVGKFEKGINAEAPPLANETYEA